MFPSVSKLNLLDNFMHLLELRISLLVLQMGGTMGGLEGAIAPIGTC